MLKMAKSIPTEEKLVSLKIQLPKIIKLKLLEFAQRNCRTLNNEILYIILESIKQSKNSNNDLIDFLREFISEKNRNSKRERKPNLVLYKND